MRLEEVVAALFASLGAGVLLAPLTVATFVGLSGLRDCWRNERGFARLFGAALVLSTAGATWVWAGPLLVGGGTGWWRPGGAMEGWGVSVVTAAVGVLVLGALAQVLRGVVEFLTEYAPVLIREWSDYVRWRSALGKDETAEGLRRRRDWLRTVAAWLESELDDLRCRYGTVRFAGLREWRLARRLARTRLALGIVEEALEEAELLEDWEVEEDLEEEFEAGAW